MATAVETAATRKLMLSTDDSYSYVCEISPKNILSLKFWLLQIFIDHKLKEVGNHSGFLKN